MTMMGDITMRSALALLLAGATGLSACTTTHLTSEKVTPGVVSTLRGAPYSLQFTQYAVKITRTVVDCGSDLKMVNKAEITPALVDDGAHTYVIPLDSLTSDFKISDLKVEYVNGRLSSVNAAAEDRTAQTILAAAQGVGKVVTTLASGGVVGAAGTVESCSDEAIAKLVDVRDAKKAIEKHKAEIDRSKVIVQRLTAAWVAAGSNPKDNGPLKKAVDALEAAALNLAAEEERLKQALGFLSYETTVTWPEHSNTFESGKPYEVPLDRFKTWYDMPRKPNEAEQDWKDRIKAKYQSFADPMQVWLAIARVGTYGLDPANAAQAANVDSGVAEDGIRFRLPANGRLLVCQKAACKRDATDDVVKDHSGAVAQLGLIYYAPFKSPPFTNATFELQLDDQGRPKKMGTARKTAAAETIAGLGKDLAGEFSTVYGALHKTAAEKAAEELATLEMEKKLVDARAALDPNSSAKQLAALEMQKKLMDAQAALQPAPTYELARLTAIAEAQKKYDDAILALQPNANASWRDQQLAIEAETAKLKAEASRIEAQIILRDVKARLGTP